MPTLPGWLRRVRALWGHANASENAAAVALCLIVIGALIVTADTAPQWIYQGF